jgi:hypothetical protein
MTLKRKNPMELLIKLRRRVNVVVTARQVKIILAGRRLVRLSTEVVLSGTLSIKINILSFILLSWADLIITCSDIFIFTRV